LTTLEERVSESGLQEKVFDVVLRACVNFGLVSLTLGLEFTLSWLLATVREMQEVHPDLRPMRHPDLVRSLPQLDDAEGRTWKFFDELVTSTEQLERQELLLQAPNLIREIAATVDGITTAAEHHLFSARLAAMARQWATARVYAAEAARLFRDAGIPHRRREAEYVECVCSRHPPRTNRSLAELALRIDRLRAEFRDAEDRFGEMRALSERVALELRIRLNQRFEADSGSSDQFRDSLERSSQLFVEVASIVKDLPAEPGDVTESESGRPSKQRNLEL
jgi:hypothetical protein